MQPNVVLAPNDIAVAAFSKMGEREYLVAAPAGPGRELVAQRFEQSGEARSLEPSQRMDWGVPVPAGTRVWVAESGRGIDELMQAWAGWTSSGSLTVLSAGSPGTPAIIPVADGDLVAYPPVMVGSGRLRAFVFRRLGAGVSLVAHEAALGDHAPPAVKTETVATLPGMPRLAASAAVPYVRTRDVAVVGWVLAGERACTVGLALHRGGAAAPATVDIAGLRPVGGRLAVRAEPVLATFDDTGLPGGLEVAFVAEQTERGGWAVVRAAYDVKAAQFHVQTTPLDLPSTPPLHSAYVWLAPFPNDDRVRVFAVRADGELLGWKDGAFRMHRAGAPLDYGFPVEPDLREPRVTPAGEIQLAPMRWDP